MERPVRVNLRKDRTYLQDFYMWQDLEQELCPVGRKPDDFNALRPPFACTVLLGGDAHLLSSHQALHSALVALAVRHAAGENNGGVGDLYPPQHVIAALHVNP